jgi:hypothetical protein
LVTIKAAPGLLPGRKHGLNNPPVIPQFVKTVRRLWELDALRGLMLVLMTLTHLPTRLSEPFGQPFGYVSAAEGFVLLSAYMAGLVYGRLAKSRGIDAMRTAFWLRARKVYLAHAALLFFLFTAIAAVGMKADQPAVKYLMDFYLLEPVRALLSGLFLLYKPPLLDILPMYVIFMLASPIALFWAHHRGWRGIMLGSLSLWFLAQFGISEWLYTMMVGSATMHLPFNETGAFSTLAWQFLWVLGLWMGASRSDVRPDRFVFPAWAVRLALLVGVTAFCWRHGVGQTPADPNTHTGAMVNMLLDKWQLGPLRLLNLMALLVLVIHFLPRQLRRAPRWLRPTTLETLGSASLPVFCAHLVIVLLTLAVWGDAPDARPWWGDSALLIACFTALYGVASATRWLERSAARRKERERRLALRARPAATASPGQTSALSG